MISINPRLQETAMCKSLEESLKESHVVVNGRYRFDYPIEFTSLPEHSARRGQIVTVLRAKNADEYDYEGDLMFTVVAADGWEGCAWESELTSTTENTMSAPMEFFDRLPPQRHPDPDRAESLVRRFNAEVQPGASIRIWTGIRGNGEGHITMVEAPGAFVLGGVAVAKYLDGGSVALTHIEVIR